MRSATAEAQDLDAKASSTFADCPGPAGGFSAWHLRAPPYRIRLPELVYALRLRLPGTLQSRSSPWRIRVLAPTWLPLKDRLGTSCVCEDGALQRAAYLIGS